ncbi:Protein PIH1D3 PIH1 domain-containing protein 3 Sarcoma antigen NY-SAR-97 [Larimichthys crocea]|uniref:Protein PIH1D3 PIH1 domain-containing protein 3 Sarcoma antigen NY-SAR-97 n=1 Tax=Larimichthys crocea TaxID=215358 RepID=A0A6G0IGC9_LARCR|nr:Protein PIH1D3 PIH1 domain-containing protein 3 Sarcoma antigen NY-SAR-97 [Larimichthys crocea]
MDCVGVHNLQALSALLSTQQDDDEDGEECKNVPACARLDPGHIGPQPKKIKKKNSKDIWSEEEVAEGSQYDDLADQRPQPEYEIILKQSVGTEDLFLGLSGKDPSSMCCEAMLVKIKLPNTKATDVVLDVKEKFLDLRTPQYKLGLHLPHPTHSQGGKAQFFSEREELEVTLPMNRPMDFINMP